MDTKQLKRINANAASYAKLYEKIYGLRLAEAEAILKRQRKTFRPAEFLAWSVYNYLPSTQMQIAWLNADDDTLGSDCAPYRACLGVFNRLGLECGGTERNGDYSQLVFTGERLSLGQDTMRDNITYEELIDSYVILLTEGMHRIHEKMVAPMQCLQGFGYSIPKVGEA